MDHPRACGEQNPSFAFINPRSGSPPRVRGTELLYIGLFAKHGITPARAGNRPFAIILEILYKDHPRACGEQHYKSEDAKIERGSPPRVRGTGILGHANSRTTRITPARAGNSCVLLKLPQMNKDHPRACGEQSMSISVRRDYDGSPPRVRGTEKNPAFFYIFFCQVNGIHLVSNTIAAAVRNHFGLDEPLCRATPNVLPKWAAGSSAHHIYVVGQGLTNQYSDWLGLVF